MAKQNAQDFQSEVLTTMIENESDANSIDDNPSKNAFLQGYMHARNFIEGTEPTPALYQEAKKAYSIYCEAETQKVIDETLQELLEEWGYELAGHDCEISDLGVAQVFYSESRGALMMRDEEIVENDCLFITARHFSDFGNEEIVRYSPDCIITPLKRVQV